MSSNFNRVFANSANSLNSLTTNAIELLPSGSPQTLWEMSLRAAPSSLASSQSISGLSSNLNTNQIYDTIAATQYQPLTVNTISNNWPLPSEVTTSANPDRRHELFFVDRTVADSDKLLAGILPSQIVYLDPSQDGVMQISAALAQRQGITAVHIIAHGDSGSLRLGNAELNGGNLDRYRDSLQSWQNSLTENADILIYGCDVAAGLQGQTFVNQISQWTGADVAASDDLTGNAALGGDWILEMGTGTIDSNILSSIDYQGVLASVSLSSGKLLYDSDGSYTIAVGNSYTTYEYKNQLTFALSGSDLLITESNTSGSYAETITAGTGMTQVNSYGVRVALSSITSGIEIKTRSGADSLAFSSGFNSFSNAVNLSIDMGDGADSFTTNTEINTFGGTFSLDGGDDNDTVAIASNLYTQGGALTISSANTLNINAGSTISTRKISGSDHSTAASIGNSGAISLAGEQITIGTSGSSSNANLFAHVGSTSYTAGNITVSASETEVAATVLDGTETSKATIALYRTHLTSLGS
jgi:hypothetical protein